MHCGHDFVCFSALIHCTLLSSAVGPGGSAHSAQVRTMPNIDFNRDERECLGRNFTFLCNVRPAEYGLVLYRRIPNASEALNYSLKLIAKSPEQESLYHAAGPSDETTPSLFRLVSFTGKLRHTLHEVTEEDAGVYQCSTRNPNSLSTFVQRTMRLTIEDCGQPIEWIFSSPHMQLVLAVVLVAILVPIVACVVTCVYRRGFSRKPLLHRRVVVVHPSANRGYPPFLHRRFSSSDNIDSLRSHSGETCSGGSSCLTPSSTLDSTASPGGGGGSLSPLRAPDVCVHSLRRTLRFTRPSESGGANEALVAPLRPPDVRVQTVRRPMRFPRASFSSNSTRWVRSRSSNLTYELPDQQAWEIARQRVTRGEQIGEGAFGVVYSGLLTEGENVTRRKVAIKMLRDDFSEEELMDLIKEMEVMKLLEPHRHIISLLGVCTRDGPLCLVNEFAPHGNLRDFLRQRRPKPGESMHQRLNRLSLPRGLLTYQHLIDFGLQVAAGLEHLASLSVVHRDIAARNVLVGEAFEAKIADFGMSRCVSNYYRKTTEGRLPVKWLAPEALFDHIFTREGDVWSFGILLWEIFSLGMTPYPSVPVERLFGLLRQGHRNDPPFYAFPQIYDLMGRCWSEQPLARPSFTELRHTLEMMRGVEEYTEILRDSPYSELAASCSYISMEA